MNKHVNGAAPPSSVLVSPVAERSEAERSEAERSVAPGETKTAPDPEVVAKAKRRQYTAEHRDGAITLDSLRRHFFQSIP